MSRLVAYAATALIIAVPSLSIAQTTQQPMQEAQSEPKDLTDIRIDVIKNALQLSPEQAKYWPAIEEAIRGRAEERRERIGSFVARMREPQSDRNFVRVLQNRSDNLAERAAGLKRLADAWEPLYPTLTDTQKRRLRVLAAVVLRDVREGVEMHRFQMMEDEDNWGGPMGGATMGTSSGEGGAGRE